MNTRNGNRARSKRRNSRQALVMDWWRGYRGDDGYARDLEHMPSLADADSATNWFSGQVFATSLDNQEMVAVRASRRLQDVVPGMALPTEELAGAHSSGLPRQ